MRSDLPYPTKTRLKVFAEVVRREIRWHHFVTPEARNIVTDRVRTAAIKEMSDAGIVDIGSADPGTYSVPEETAVGVRWAEGPGSTSPEPGPTRKPHCDHWAEGDGPCCRCSRPNWCPDEGETPEALEELARGEQAGCPAGPDGEVAP